MDWTDEHRATLKHLRPIIGPPALGRVDGTAAIVGDRGFVFLFNPNYRELHAEFIARCQHWADRRRRVPAARTVSAHGAPSGQAASTGVWRRGDPVRLPIKGPEALVLELVPADAVERPALLNARGHAALSGDRLVLDECRRRNGTRLWNWLSCCRPDGSSPESLVNGARGGGVHAIGRRVDAGAPPSPARALIIASRSALTIAILGRHRAGRIHRSATSLRSTGGAPQSLADSLHGRRTARHLARFRSTAALCPDRRSRRQVDGRG